MNSNRESEFPLSSPLAEAIQSRVAAPLDADAVERVRRQARQLAESGLKSNTRQPTLANRRGGTRSMRWRVSLAVATSVLFAAGIVWQSSSRPIVDHAGVSHAVQPQPATPTAQRTVTAPLTTARVEAVGPSKPQLLAKDQSFPQDPLTGALRVSYDNLDLFKVLKVEEVTPEAVAKMPPWQRDLDGKEIVIRGYMRPQFTETDLDGFLLVPNVHLCTFGPNPKVYELIEVTLAKGLKTDYIELRPFDVVGTLRIKLAFEDNFPQGLYYLEKARIVMN